MIWLVLLLTLLLCLPPLLLGIRDRVSTHTMENVALVTSQETWLRWHAGDTGAWLVTSNDSQPRVEKPPLLTWLDFLAWSDLSPQTSTPQQLTYRARLVSVALGLVMLASIFWIGHSLGGLRVGVLAALVASSTFLLQRQARTASYDIQFVAWATLAVASAFWAMGLRGPAPSRARQIAGWTIAGIAMACSVMSKNPLSFAIVLIPVSSALLLAPGRRWVDLMGVSAALLLALGPVLPWYWHAAHAYPEAMRTLAREFQQPRQAVGQIYYYLGLFGLVAPWTIWLICGLVHPFKIESSQRRRLALIALVWFVAIFVAFSLHPAKQQRYILPIMPAVALLCAQVLCEHQLLVESGRGDRLAKRLGGAIWAVALLVSLAMGPFLAMQDWLSHAAADWYPHGRFISIGWPAAGGMMLVLAGIAGVGWRCNAQARPWRAGVLLAVWMSILMSGLWYAESGVTPRVAEVQGFKQSAEQLAQRVGGSPLRSLRCSGKDAAAYKLNEEFRFYFGRLIPRLSPRELDDFAASSSASVYVLTRPYEQCVNALGKAGFRLIDDQVLVDEHDNQQLWMHAPPG